MIHITTTKDVAACRWLRRKVFIDEQGVSEADEIDDKDDEAIHLLAFVADHPVGTARLLISGDTGKIGRVCVLPDQRGKGIGAALIRAAVSELESVQGVSRAKLGAQTHAIDFYQALGFAAVGPIYDDAGIPHRDMVMAL